MLASKGTLFQLAILLDISHSCFALPDNSIRLLAKRNEWCSAFTCTINQDCINEFCERCENGRCVGSSENVGIVNVISGNKHYPPYSDSDMVHMTNSPVIEANFVPSDADLNSILEDISENGIFESGVISYSENEADFIDYLTDQGGLDDIIEVETEEKSQGAEILSQSTLSGKPPPKKQKVDIDCMDDEDLFKIAITGSNRDVATNEIKKRLELSENTSFDSPFVRTYQNMIESDVMNDLDIRDIAKLLNSVPKLVKYTAPDLVLKLLKMKSESNVSESERSLIVRKDYPELFKEIALQIITTMNKTRGCVWGNIGNTNSKWSQTNCFKGLAFFLYLYGGSLIDAISSIKTALKNNPNGIVSVPTSLRIAFYALSDGQRSNFIVKTCQPYMTFLRGRAKIGITRTIRELLLASFGRREYNWIHEFITKDDLDYLIILSEITCPEVFHSVVAYLKTNKLWKVSERCNKRNLEDIEKFVYTS